MKSCNVGGADRAVRFVIGVTAFLAAFMVESTAWSVAAFVIAGVALLTAVLRYCPMNALLHVNTCRARAARPPEP